MDGKSCDIEGTGDIHALPWGSFWLMGAMLLLVMLAQPGCCLVCIPYKAYETPDEAVRALGRSWTNRDYRAMLSCLDAHGRWSLCGVVRAKMAFDSEADILKETIRYRWGPEGVAAYEKSIQGGANSVFLSCFGWPLDADPSGDLRAVVEGKGAYIYLDKEMLGLTAVRTDEGWIVLPPWYPEFRGVGQIQAMIDYSTAQVRKARLRVQRGEVNIEDIPELLHR